MVLTLCILLPQSLCVLYFEFENLVALAHSSLYLQDPVYNMTKFVVVHYYLFF